MQDASAPVEKNFHPDHPEQSTITISIGTDSRGTGAQALAFMVAHALANAGFENVRVDSAQNSQAMAEVAKAGFTPKELSEEGFSDWVAIFPELLRTTETEEPSRYGM